MSQAFALEQLDVAVRTLAVGPDRVRARLARAFADSLARVDSAKDLPAPLRARFEDVRHALTHLGGRPAEPWAASIGLDEPTAARLAAEIVDIATDLRSRLHRT